MPTSTPEAVKDCTAVQPSSGSEKRIYGVPPVFESPHVPHTRKSAETTATDYGQQRSLNYRCNALLRNYLKSTRGKRR